MIDLTELHGLVQRTTDPDRELDAALWLALIPGATRKATPASHPLGDYTIDETRDASGCLIIVPKYTGNISCALDLMVSALGQVDFEMKSGYLGPYSSFRIGKAYSLGRFDNNGDAARPDDLMALAICEAVLCVRMAGDE